MLSGIVLLSGGSILYIRAHKGEAAAVSSNGSPVELTAPSTEKSLSLDSSPSQSGAKQNKPLKVTSGDSSSNSNSTATTATAAATAPGPETFGQYDQYKTNTDPLIGDLKVGDGIVAAVNNTATVNYKGWLTNGKEFDESYARGKPFDFVIGQHKVILGWEKAILGMKVGGKRRFIIPPSDGYGSQAQNGIPGDSVLVFDVELLGLK